MGLIRVSNKTHLVILIFILIFISSCSNDKTIVNHQNPDNKSLSASNVYNSTGYTKDQQTEIIQSNQLCNNTSLKLMNYTSGLLSPRVYAGLLEPQSYLITNFEPLRSDIRNYLQDGNISASVYIENLRNGVNIGINQNRGYFPASLNKLPVAILVMQNIEDGKLSYDTLLPLEDSERSSASGMLYLSDKKQMSVRELLEAMLNDSDNTAFDVLYNHIDKKELRKLLEYYNININVDYPYRRLEFIYNTDQVTSISMYNLFSSLYLSTVFTDPKDSEYLLSLLANSDFDVKTLASLPENVTVAQKYGEYYEDHTQQFHDSGIIYIGQSRIFYCIMTRGLESEDAKQAIGFIVNHVYNYVTYERSKLDKLKKPNGQK